MHQSVVPLSKVTSNMLNSLIIYKYQCTFVFFSDIPYAYVEYTVSNLGLLHVCNYDGDSTELGCCAIPIMALS